MSDREEGAGRSDAEGDGEGEHERGSATSGEEGRGYDADESLVGRRRGKLPLSADTSPVRLPAPSHSHTRSADQAHPHPSRKNSGVDLMIAETLISPRDAEEGRPGSASTSLREARERDPEYAYGASSNGVPLEARGYPQFAEKPPLAPLPFAGVAAPTMSASSSSSASVAPPLEGGSASAPVPIRPANDAAGTSLSARGRGSKTPSKKVGAVGPTPNRRGITARAASNYGPKVVACNFCRGGQSFPLCSQFS